MKEMLHSGIDKFRNEMAGFGPGVSEIEKQIFKMEAKMESIRGRDSDWHSELNQLRKQRTDHQRQARLIRFKTQMQAKQLPAANFLSSNMAMVKS